MPVQFADMPMSKDIAQFFQLALRLGLVDGVAVERWADADALRTLAEHGRFRIIRECGRMVVGYWPENDPNVPAQRPPATDV